MPIHVDYREIWEEARMMAGEELLEERLIKLPMCLETITVSAGAITQTAGLSQSAWSNQNGGL
jgi:hypothetical protein